MSYKTEVTVEQHLEILKTQFYSYKEKDYKVIKIVMIKSVVTNVWFPGVEYQALYDVPQGQWEGSFIRPVANFIELFSPTIK